MSQSSNRPWLKGIYTLGNGCAMEVQRHENIISRVLALRQKLYVSVIADGIHLPYWLLKSFVDIIGCERVIITSDSMSAAGMPPGEYQISGQPIIVDEDRRARHRDHNYLAGSASTLQEMKLHSDRWLPPNLRIYRSTIRAKCQHSFQSSVNILGRWVSREATR